MFITFAVRIIGRSQKHSFRSIMGFALIISMMIAIAGVITGFSEQIFNITTRAGESPSIFIEANNEEVGIPSDILNFLDHTNIKSILPITQRNMLIVSSVSSFYSNVIGLNVSLLMKYYVNADIYAGGFPQSNDSYYECLVGKNLQLLLGSSIINISDSINIITQNFHVSGLIQNIKELQNSIILDFNDYWKFFNHTSSLITFNKIKISLKNGFFVKQTIFELKSSLKDYLSHITIKPEQQTDIFTERLFIDILSKLNLLFGVLFIIALIRVFHTISWFVRKYERDLLIMRAMGLSTIQIISLVVFLAGLIGNLGFIMGLLFGVLIPSLLFTILTIFLQGGFYAPDFSLNIIIMLFILSNIISLIAALYPAISIAHKSPSSLTLATHGFER